MRNDYILSTSLETQNRQAPSTMLFDEAQNQISPFMGGISVTDFTGDVVTRKGRFVPAMDEGKQCALKISYSFVDHLGNLVAPTSDGRIIILKIKDENGEIYPVSQKIMEVNVAQEAIKQLGEGVDTRLLGIVYDYEGNLWFVTGGFRIVPDRDPAGFIGYLSREYIDGVLGGENPSLDGNIFFHALGQGESAENGISSNEDGAVILTNQACYMVGANDGVEVIWRTEYKSNGANDAQEGSAYTGSGLAWGSGTTPTLTKDLVLFTDNLDPVNLVALSSKTGEVVAQMPVLDNLPESVPVSVENSILVYSGGPERASVIVCNWFGAGNAGLGDADADSSIQSYANVYDANWMQKGNEYIAPGVERVDVIRAEDGSYRMETVWMRDDIRDTSMIKLSTATGYLYGYWQNMETGMWCFEILDFNTGETLKEIPVSNLPSYNNMAVGMSADVKGNTLYCPTNNMEIVMLQDSFVYLPDSPVRTIDPDHMERYWLTAEEFKQQSGTELSCATYLMRVQLSEQDKGMEVAFRVNGLEGKASEFKLFEEDGAGGLRPAEDGWSLTDSEGKPIDGDTVLDQTAVYEIRVQAADRAVVSALLAK